VSDLIHEAKIALTLSRCWDCGRYWAREHAFCHNEGTCPFCAKAAIERAVESETKALRSVASLRGALTKAKGKR